NEIGAGLDYAEADDEGDDQRRRGNPEFLGADQWDYGAFDPDHAADKGVYQDEQGELPPIGAQPKTDLGCSLRRTTRVSPDHSAAASLPELTARTSAACGGGGGISASMTRRKSASSSMRNALLNRFSKPIVDAGLPLRLRPQTDPE